MKVLKCQYPNRKEKRYNNIKLQYHVRQKAMHAQTYTILVTLKEGKFNTAHKYEGKDFIHYQTHNLM